MRRTRNTGSGTLDEKFYENLLQKYSKLMYFTAERYRIESVDSRDIVQESLLSLLKGDRETLLKSFPEETLVSYIYYTVKNTAISLNRKQARFTQAELPLEEQGLEEIQDPRSWVSQTELHIVLDSLLDDLPENERLLLTYKYLLDYSNDEIAALFGWKKDSVRMMLSRARQKALKLLEDKGVKLE